MANFVPAFMPPLYLLATRLLQRPAYGILRPRLTVNLHGRREGIMKAYDRGVGAPGKGDLRECPPPAADRNHRLRRAHDQRIPHLAHPGREGDIDARVGIGGIGTRENPDGEAARLLGAARRRRHDAAEPAAYEDCSALGDQSTHGARPLGLLRRALRAADDRHERSPHRRLRRSGAAQYSAVATARRHSARRSWTARRFRLGRNCVNRRPARKSRGAFQTPSSSPASAAAPSAVVSSTSGRATGTPSRSAWNCIKKSFAAAPPSTWSARSVSCASAVMASSTSLVLYAIASSAARARWARLVPRVSPTIVPRALGSH